MSTEPIKHVCRKMDQLIEVARGFGSVIDDPFMALSFMALPVIPEIKITDMGLVDVSNFQFIPLFIE